MSAPALIRQADAKRLLAAAREVGFTNCELSVDLSGKVRLVAKFDEVQTKGGSDESWSDDDR